MPFNLMELKRYENRWLLYFAFYHGRSPKSGNGTARQMETTARPQHGTEIRAVLWPFTEQLHTSSIPGMFVRGSVYPVEEES